MIQSSKLYHTQLLSRTTIKPSEIQSSKAGCKQIIVIGSN